MLEGKQQTFHSGRGGQKSSLRLDEKTLVPNYQHKRVGVAWRGKMPCSVKQEGGHLPVGRTSSLIVIRTLAMGKRWEVTSV